MGEKQKVMIRRLEKCKNITLTEKLEFDLEHQEELRRRISE